MNPYRDALEQILLEHEHDLKTEKDNLKKAYQSQEYTEQQMAYMRGHMDGMTRTYLIMQGIYNGITER
jgi:hypothetical protein